MSRVIRRLNHLRVSFAKHNVSAYAAQTAFFVLLAFFPFIMLVLETIKFLPFTEIELLKLILSVTPDSLDNAITELVTELYESDSNVIPLTVITTLWSSSKGVYSLMNCMNSIYNCTENRSYFRRRGLAILYTIIFLAVFVFSVGIMLVTDWLLTEIISLFGLQALIKAVRLSLQAIMLSLLFSVIYRVFPAKKKRFSELFPGAALSACGWIAFTELYSIYITFKNTNLYGSLTTVILTILWLYVCIYILLMGAEINIFLSKLEKKR